MQTGKLAPRDAAQKPFEKQVRHHLKRPGRFSGILLSLPFVVELQCQLMKREELDIEQGELALDAQELFDPALERNGRNDDGQGNKRISGFQRLDFFDKCCFEIRMVATGDDLEHESLTVFGFAFYD